MAPTRFYSDRQREARTRDRRWCRWPRVDRCRNIAAVHSPSCVRGLPAKSGEENVIGSIDFPTSRCAPRRHCFNGPIAQSIVYRTTRSLLPSITRLCLATLILWLAMPAARAQDPDDSTVHWAYASYFGTGLYALKNDLSVFAIRASPRWSWGEPGLEDDGTMDIGIEFRLPITFSLQKFNLDDLGPIFDIDNFATLSVTPGIELELPVTERWSLKPLVYAGWGTELDGPESAWIYWAGVKSRYRLGSGKLDWALVNSIEYIGYTPNEGSSNDAFPVMAGLEFRSPLGNARLDGQQVYLDWHVTYTAYFDDLKFLVRDVPIRKIGDTWELALSYSKGERKLKLWRLEWDRIGLAYRFSSSGEFKGVALVFRSVFDS